MCVCVCMHCSVYTRGRAGPDRSCVSNDNDIFLVFLFYRENTRISREPCLPAHTGTHVFARRPEKMSASRQGKPGALPVKKTAKYNLFSIFVLTFRISRRKKSLGDVGRVYLLSEIYGPARFYIPYGSRACTRWN